MKLKHAKKNSGFTLVELLVVIAIIAGLAAISSPIIIKQIAKSRATQALNNGKDIYIGLRDYSFEIGALPTAKTKDADLAFETVILKGNIVDEKPFTVKGVPGATEGDGNIKDAAAIFAGAGDNVFGYGDNGTAGWTIATASANAPLMACPVSKEGTIDVAEFNTGAFGNQGVIITADGSAVAYKLVPPAGATAGGKLPVDATDNMFTAGGTDAKSTWRVVAPKLVIPGQ